MQSSKINRLEFEQGSPGYDEESVDRFLDQVMEEMERLVLEIAYRELGEAVESQVPITTTVSALPPLSEAPTGYAIPDVNRFISGILAERDRLWGRVQELRQG